MNNSCHVGNMGRPLASVARRAGEDHSSTLQRVLAGARAQKQPIFRHLAFLFTGNFAALPATAAS